jgi:hypothetical protein
MLSAGARGSPCASATPLLANATPRLLACGASVLQQALPPHTCAHTTFAPAQPSTVLLTLFQVATHVKQSQDRRPLPLPTSRPGKALRHRVTTRRTARPRPALHTS